MRKKILVVDDHAGILEVVQTVLAREGYDVQVSLNGDCLHHMKSDLPDLILLDVLLSGEDGRELCQQLKSSEQTKHIPVILLSAHTNVSQVAAMCGADDFLAKPFRVNVLKELVKKYL